MGEFNVSRPMLPFGHQTPLGGGAPLSDGSEVVEGTSTSIRYDILCQTNPTYDRETLEEIEDLYVGGYRMQRNAKRYLLKMPNEPDQVFDVRSKVASYVAYFGAIVDSFASSLFGQPLSVDAAADAKDPTTPGEPPDKVYYPKFATNCDGRGKSFIELMKVVMTTALKKRYALIMVDAPSEPAGAPPPMNRAEEEQRGARDLYAYEIPVEQMIDWEKNEKGELQFAVLRKSEQRRAGPRTKREVIHESFTIWEIGDDGFARWERYEIAYKPSDKPRPETMVPRVAEGSTNFRRIPIHCLELPEGLWIGNKIGTQAKEHYQRRTSLVTAEYRSLVAIPVARLGPEFGGPGGAVPSEVQQNPARGRNPVASFEQRGFVCIGSGDSIEYAEPSGHCYELVGKELGELKDEMYRVSHQMAQSLPPTPTALGRSGLSKQKDEDETNRVLRALGGIARTCAGAIYETISKARDEDVVWVVAGLDSYDIDDRQEVVAESLQLDAIQIPSKTFRKEMKRAAAERLVGKYVNSQTMATIRDEIDQGVDDEEDLRQLKTEAETAETERRKKPPAPPAPGPGQQPPTFQLPKMKLAPEGAGASASR